MELVVRDARGACGAADARCPAPPDRFAWDGTDRSGQTVPEGTYYSFTIQQLVGRPI
jgi:flagellar hook assembly protein FlgD